MKLFVITGVLVSFFCHLSFGQDLCPIEYRSASDLALNLEKARVNTLKVVDCAGTTAIASVSSLLNGVVETIPVFNALMQPAAETELWNRVGNKDYRYSWGDSFYAEDARASDLIHLYFGELAGPILADILFGPLKEAGHFLFTGEGSGDFEYFRQFKTMYGAARKTYSDVNKDLGQDPKFGCARMEILDKCLDKEMENREARKNKTVRGSANVVNDERDGVKKSGLTARGVASPKTSKGQAAKH